MRFGLIGCGRIAINHIKAVVANNLYLQAVCDIVPEHIDILFEKTGFDKDPKRYTDYKKMIEENPDLELVAIATDSGVHAEIALFCINKGLNVIIEKPMAMSIDDANKMIEVAKKNNVKLSVAH